MTYFIPAIHSKFEYRNKLCWADHYILNQAKMCQYHFSLKPTRQQAVSEIIYKETAYPSSPWKVSLLKGHWPLSQGFPLNIGSTVNMSKPINIMQPSHILRFKIAKTDHFILQQQSKAIITRSHTIDFYHFLKNICYLISYHRFWLIAINFSLYRAPKKCLHRHLAVTISD